MQWSLAASLALIAGVLAGAARAEPAPKPPAPAVRAPALVLPVTYGRAQTPMPSGTVRTSVERRSSAEGVTGAAGFLCGRDPIADSQGAAAMTGYDPHGRFLGAKLSFSF